MSFEFYSASGELLRQIELDDVKRGYNELTIDIKALGFNKIVYYRISTEDFTASKKMIISD